MTALLAPISIGAEHTRYSVLWFGEASEASANEMLAIEEWARTAVTITCREHGMLAAIAYAATGALAAGILLHAASFL
jgi:hypothetical protein